MPVVFSIIYVDLMLCCGTRANTDLEKVIDLGVDL